jgi:hypothetical protein
VSIAAPLFLWIASAVALATVAAHLLAWRRPPSSPLPTARFAPERPARVVSRAVRPTDLLLLALRVAMVMLVGLALARPTFARERRGEARVVVIDRSRSVGDARAVTDSARAVFRPGDALVVFDSSAREVTVPAADSIPFRQGAAAPRARGSLSAALVAAVRSAERLARERDSVEIVIVSPVTLDEIDAATLAIRDRWPGPVRVVRAGATPSDTLAPARPDVRASAGDPVVAALSLVGPVDGGATVRVRRADPTAADTAWARGGGTLVAWPVSQPPARWNARPDPDTAFSVIASVGSGLDAASATTATVVAPFERAADPPPGRAIAYWGDGSPAATETSLGGGCVRSVAVRVPVVGDLALTPAFRSFARRMAEPCDGSAGAVVPDSIVARVLAPAPRDVRASEPARDGERGDGSRLAAWLLAFAFALAVGEMAVRRGVSHATT